MVSISNTLRPSKITFSFKEPPDFAKIDGSLKEKVIFDGRNVFEMDTMRKHGYTYYSIGRKDIK